MLGVARALDGELEALPVLALLAEVYLREARAELLFAFVLGPVFHHREQLRSFQGTAVQEKWDVRLGFLATLGEVKRAAKEGVSAQLGSIGGFLFIQTNRVVVVPTATGFSALVQTLHSTQTIAGPRNFTLGYTGDALGETVLFLV